MTAQTILDWITTHAAAAWPIVSAVLILVLRSRTPEAWVALGESHPRVQGVVRLLRAVGVDPAKAVSALVQIVTARAPERPAPSAPAAPPSPSSGQRGAVRVSVLLAISGALLVASVTGVVLQGCPPPPPSDGGTPVVTPSDWTRTARIATTVGRGLLPVAQVIVEATTTDPGRTQARRAFAATDAALLGLERALDAYDARGGDRCAAYAAAGAAVVALQELATILAQNGIALGVPLERIVDLVGSVVDTLVPACNLDAGFASAGRTANATLLSIERDARSRGVILRRDLDRIVPALDGGVR